MKSKGKGNPFPGEPHPSGSAGGIAPTKSAKDGCAQIGKMESPICLVETWLQGSLADCEPEWFLTEIPKDEMEAAVRWEYARECRELRESVKTWRIEFEPSKKAAQDIAFSSLHRADWCSPECYRIERAELEKRVSITSYDENCSAIWRFKCSQFARTPEFPLTPWRLLDAKIRAKLTGKIEKRGWGKEAEPLVDSPDVFCQETVRLICELDEQKQLPPFWQFGVPFEFSFSGSKRINALVHIDLDANADDAAAAFRRLFSGLKERHKIAPKPSGGGRKNSPLDALRQLGALRLHFLNKPNGTLAPFAEKLGYKSSDGSKDERNRQIAKSVADASKNACELFQTMFGEVSNPIHRRMP